MSEYFESQTVPSAPQDCNEIVDALAELAPRMFRVMGRFLDRYPSLTPNLPPAQIRILQELAEHGKPANMGELASALAITAGSLTPGIKKLVSLGFVTRERSSEDDRVVLLTLSKKGLSRAVEEKTSLMTAFGEIVQALSASERGDFLNAHRRILEILEIAAGKNGGY
ncbi:MAG: MarR family transcriptional regulator [Oligoflexia bacterium]|nr:MarR family transcriptional regulator [Oligoflexia bacterium]